jgi:hypothetical protein
MNKFARIYECRSLILMEGLRNHTIGAIYSRITPKENAAKPACEWTVLTLPSLTARYGNLEWRKNHRQ